MRAIAALMVVLLHSGSAQLVVVGKPDAFQWSVIHAVEAAIQVCVPLFFMISGALLVNSTRRPVKSLLRAVVPLAFYTSIAVLYQWVTKGTSLTDTVWTAWASKGFYHLWFFYPLIGIYACFYFLHGATEAPGRRALAILVFLILLGGGTGHVASTYEVGSRLFVDGTFFGFLLYGFLGFYLRHWLDQSGREHHVMWGALIGYSVMWMVTIMLSRATNEVGVRYNGLFFTYQAPNMVLQSAFAFVLMSKIGEYVGRFARPRQWVSFLAAYSLGLFGIHAFVMDALRFHTPIGLRSEHALLHFAGLFGLTVVISLIIAVAIGRLDRQHIVV